MPKKKQCAQRAVDRVPPQYWLVSEHHETDAFSIAGAPVQALHAPRWTWISPEKLLERSRPDCLRLTIAIDLDLLQIDPDDYLREARRRFPQAMFLALSQQDSARAALKCLRSGFEDYLVKPCSWMELTQVADRAASLRKPWSSDANALVTTSVLTQIAGSQSVPHVHWLVVTYLKRIWNASSVSWFSVHGNRGRLETTTSESPTAIAGPTRLQIQRWKATARTFFPCQARTNGFVWIERGQVATSKRQRNTALVIEHAEIALENLHLYETVRQQTLIDDLTGTYNARYFKQMVQWQVKRSETSKEPFSLLFLDLDRFKAVNDTHGHSVGSELLIALAKTLKNELRGHDPLFRYGGDEFIVVLAKAGPERAVLIAERLRKKIESRSFRIREVEIRVTLSIGVAAFPLHAKSSKDLLRMADEAMYEAKRDSRNAVRLSSVPTHPARVLEQDAS